MIQEGLLIAFDVVLTASEPNASVGNLSSVQAWANESHCISHAPDGKPWGWQLMECRKDNLPAPFSATHVLHRSADGYTSRSCLLPLSSPQVKSILQDDADALEELDTVVETALPKRTEGDLWIASRRSRFGHVLLLRASEEVLLEEREESVSSTTISNLLLTLNKQETAAVPCKLFDIILFPSPIPGLDDQWTILWLNNTVLAPNSKEIHIPKTALDLIDYACAIHTVEHLTRSLKELPLGKRTASEYVRDIVGRRGKFLKKYSGHLEDRDKTIHGLLETGRTFLRISRELETNYVKVGITRKHGVHYPGAVTHSRKFLILTRLEGALEESTQEYSVVRSELESHEAALKEYLRDYLAAEVAESNLAIQRKMQWLTIIAVIAAILALLASVLGDDDKKAIRHLLGLSED
jgi:hypothetical protein